MKYRIRKCIAPDCVVDRGTYSNFEDAYRTYQWEGVSSWIEKKAKGGWTRLTALEIAKKRVKKVTLKKIELQTDTETYTFKLPRPVQVPNNMTQANAALYITLDLLGIKPTVKNKKDTGVY